MLYEIRQKAINSEDEEKKTITKFIMNRITGNLGSPHSFVYNIQSRFDLIMIVQIIFINLIDFVLNNKMEVSAMNTDEFIIKIKIKDIKTILND